MTTDTPLDDYAGHTPGPWEWSEHQFNAPPFEGTLERECGIYPPLGESGPVAIANGKANARLIAAAPMILKRARELERDLAECRAALRELDDLTKRWTRTHSKPYDTPEEREVGRLLSLQLDAAWSAARAILAKGEGK